MFKNLKSLFIIEEEDKSKGEKPTKETPKAQVTPKKPIAPMKDAPIQAGPGQVSKKFTDVLLNAMQGANLDGFDYLEYKQSLNSLKKMSMDEATQYQSAYAMAQTMGATPEHLVKTAQHYINVLQTEEKKFEEALVAQKSKQIGSKEQEIKTLECTIKN